MKNYAFRKVMFRIFLYLLMAFFLILTLYPIFWMLSGSLKTESEFFSNVWGLPHNPQFQNYAEAWQRAGLREPSRHGKGRTERKRHALSLRSQCLHG